MSTTPPSVDYIYWAFSAAAQSISAFVALLLAGYALVNSLLESARERDDSLEEIYEALRIKYHKWLRWLAVITGVAIVSSLAIAYFNRPNAPIHGIWLLLVAILDLLAIFGGLAFAVAIVDPRKYRKIAQQELRQEEQEVGAPQHEVGASEFFDAFLHLEKLVREYLRARELYVPSRGAPRMSYSFRQMIEALLQNEKIDRQFFEELQEINKHRNLVFHGHVQSVDRGIVERLRAAANRIEKME